MPNGNGNETANGLTQAILQYLRLRGIFAWRNNTGAMAAADGEHRNRFIRFGQKGSGDILGIIPPHGVFLSIEVKVGNDRLRPSQIEWMHEVQAMGGIAIVSHKLEDVEAIFGYRMVDDVGKPVCVEPLPGSDAPEYTE